MQTAVNKSPKILQIPPSVRSLLESILNDAGLNSLDQKMRDEMITNLYLKLDKYMLTTIVANLPADKLEEFTKMAETGKNQEELNVYLKKHIPDAEKIFARSMLEFRELYLGTVENARNHIASSTQVT